MPAAAAGCRPAGQVGGLDWIGIASAGWAGWCWCLPYVRPVRLGLRQVIKQINNCVALTSYRDDNVTCGRQCMHAAAYILSLSTICISYLDRGLSWPVGASRTLCTIHISYSCWPMEDGNGATQTQPRQTATLAYSCRSISMESTLPPRTFSRYLSASLPCALPAHTSPGHSTQSVVRTCSLLF